MPYSNTDEHAELHGDKFYMNFTNDDARPGLVFVTLNPREDAVNHGEVPNFDIYQYITVPEARRLVNELNVVLARVKRPD